MTPAPQGHPPTAYLIRVAGRLDAHWSGWFDGLAVTDGGDGTTSLSGSVADQAQLHGLLAKIRDLGLGLISVETIDPPKPVRSRR